MNKLRYRRLLGASICCFGIASAAFLLIPFASFRQSGIRQILAYGVGVLFWGGMAGGLFLTHRLSVMRKQQIHTHSLAGIFRFFSSKPARMTDIAMIVSVNLTAVSVICLSSVHILSVAAISVTVFLICLHSILNGSNYAFLREVTKP